MDRMKQNWKRKKPLIFLLIAVGIALLFAVVMFLWNAILPDVLGVSVINYWQAAGITILSKILFGGFKGGGPQGDRIKHKLKAKFMNMTEEEKANFKAEWKNRRGH